jgi:L-ascorbate metabolism protein UlaG (beta-lactamase superfamily)
LPDYRGHAVTEEVSAVLERVTWFRNSAFRWQDEGLTVYVDPWGIDDPTPADVILITHAHYDHFVPDDIDKIRTERTKLAGPRDVANELRGDVTIASPGATLDVGCLEVQCVPAYNIAEERLEFHPDKNGWVGYILEFGGRVYYHAGDTDHLPELESIRSDVAFLPCGGKFTMDPQQAAGLAKAMSPGLAVPMHYGFVSGSSADGRTFKDAAAPVPVEVLEPTNAFERL